jgi:hypothetical protein
LVKAKSYSHSLNISKYVILPNIIKLSSNKLYPSLIYSLVINVILLYKISSIYISLKKHSPFKYSWKLEKELIKLNSKNKHHLNPKLSQMPINN